MSGLRAVLAIVLASAALAACGSESATLSGQAIVSSIPWASGEQASYRIMDGDEVKGSGVLAISTQDDRVTLRQSFESEEFRDEAEVVVDGGTLAPRSVQREIDGPDGKRRWEVAYGESSAAIVQTSDKDRREDAVSVPTRAYDSWSDVFLWRTIDFREGYEASYADVLSATLARPQVISQTLRVTGKETVEVPAGTFEAWRLEIRTADGSQEAWYADTPARPLVRYDNGSLVFELLTLE